MCFQLLLQNKFSNSCSMFGDKVYFNPLIIDSWVGGKTHSYTFKSGVVEPTAYGVNI